MKKLIEAVLENLSTKQTFRFRVSCGCCRTAYGNKPIKFSKAGQRNTVQNIHSSYNSLYEQEFQKAKQIAINSAAEHMNHCPICKNLVCNDCFLICEEADMCMQCAEDLEQQGKPVSSGLLAWFLKGS
ncbi:MAG: hypothetical protein IKT58_06545 [Oscillospiraceae bacterium]|nr:hypothetical protein [Oscillospiraceae bacterium]